MRHEKTWTLKASVRQQCIWAFIWEPWLENASSRNLLTAEWLAQRSHSAESALPEPFSKLHLCSQTHTHTLTKYLWNFRSWLGGVYKGKEAIVLAFLEGSQCRCSTETPQLTFDFYRCDWQQLPCSFVPSFSQKILALPSLVLGTTHSPEVRVGQGSLLLWSAQPGPLELPVLRK